MTAGAETAVEVWPGSPFPLGATWDGQGTNFSLFSQHAEGVELCLFDDDGAETRVEVSGRRALTGTAICRASGRGSATGIAFAGPTTPPADTGSTRRSC